MKQTNAINTVLSVVQTHEAVLAAFLKGSLGSDTGDEYSDVDFYCLVQNERMSEFLDQRRAMLEHYRPILFWAEVNYVGPQVVVIFDDGLHFDLYAVTLEALPATCPIKILYDPQNLLADYPAEPLTCTFDYIVGRFDSFLFALFEFVVAFRRGNLIWAHHLAGQLPPDFGFVYRYLHDPDHAQLSLRNIDRIMDEPTRQRMINAAQADLLERVVRYIDLLRDTANAYPAEQQKMFNWVFFDFVHQRILSLIKKTN